MVDLARQGDGIIFAHVGGSPEALDDLKAVNTLKDVNEYFHASTFWRSKQRSAPHNVFTSTSRLRSAFSENGDRSGFMPIAGRFKEDMPPVTSSRPCFLVTFGGENGYDVKWCYRDETNDFVRSMNGAVEKTKDGYALTASQVMIMQTNIETIDAVGRKQIKTTGQNQAILLQDGVFKYIGWEKVSRSAPLSFRDVSKMVKDGAGEPVLLRPGAVWVEVVDSSWPVLWYPDDAYHDQGTALDITVYSQ